MTTKNTAASWHVAIAPRIYTIENNLLLGVNIEIKRIKSTELPASVHLHATGTLFSIQMALVSTLRHGYK